MKPVSPKTPRPGVIVLEGADASGKTTLARYLCEHYGARYLHNGPYRDAWRWHIGCYLLAEHWVREGHLVVVDRHWISELVYGLVYRGGGQYPVAARCLDRLWLRLGALNVLCVPNSAQAQIDRHERLRRERHEYASDISHVVYAYRALAGEIITCTLEHLDRPDYLEILRKGRAIETRLDWIRYDLDIHGRDLGGWCRAAIDRMPRHEPMRLLTPNSVGGHVRTSGRRWLIVGEQPGPGAHKRHYFPFIARELALSDASNYLNCALQWAGVDEGRLRWVNALEPDGSTAINLEMEVNQAMRRGVQILALGETAARKLDRFTRGYDRLHHPGFERLFKSEYPPKTYAKQLGELLND